MPAPPTPILKLTDIHKSYNVGTPVETEVLHGITLALREAEFVALKGPSGSGKSTLLNIIGLLERPDRRHAGDCGPADPVAGRRRPHAAARRHHRLRVPVPPPVAGLHRAGERAAAVHHRARHGHARGRGLGAASCWRAWA
jgi:ABC-type glutathione transport system ATPase component